MVMLGRYEPVIAAMFRPEYRLREKPRTLVTASL
jgi:hypothetical protein